MITVMYILAPRGWCFGGNSFGLTATQLSALVTQPGGLHKLFVYQGLYKYAYSAETLFESAS